MTYGDVQLTVLSGTSTLGARETFDRSGDELLRFIDEPTEIAEPSAGI